jgi:gas vesicle protein
MASKDYNLEFWEEKLSDLEQDYETVKSQLRNELDGPTQNKLKRQLEQIGREMEAYEEHIQAREQELQENAAPAALDSDEIPAPVVAGGVFILVVVIFGACSQMNKNPAFTKAVQQTGIQQKWLRQKETEQLSRAKYKGLEGSYRDAANIYQRIASDTATTCMFNYAVRLRDISSKAQQLKDEGKNPEAIQKKFKAALENADSDAMAIRCPVK